MTLSHKTTRRILSVTVFAVCLVVGSVITNTFSSATDRAADKVHELQSEPRSLTVIVRKIQPAGNIERLREYTGNIRAARESQLSFERGGRIISVEVEEGDRVEQGQTLAEIDVDQVASRVNAVSAQLEQARAVLDELRAGPRKETIAATRAKLASFEAEAKRLELNLGRSNTLMARSAISQERLDEAKYSLEYANAQRDAVQKELDELLAGTRRERIAAQAATVKQLEAEVATLRLDIADGKLVVPFAGRVAERIVDEGTVVSASSPVLRIVEDHRLEAWIGVPPDVAKDLRPGETFTATVGGDAVRSMFVSRRPRLDDITRTQNLVFRIAEADASSLVPGQIIRIAFAQQIETNGYVLPTTSLVPAPRGLWNLFVVGKDNRLEQRSIELLYSLGENVVVAGTIAAGDDVVVDGTHRVVVGQQVRPVMETSTDIKVGDHDNGGAIDSGANHEQL